MRTLLAILFMLTTVVCSSILLWFFWMEAPMADACRIVFSIITVAATWWAVKEMYLTFKY